MLQAGWLAIPASLFLLAGCQGPVMERVDGRPEQPVYSHEILTPDADVWVLTFFDLYCVACQQSADNFARLNSILTKEKPAGPARMLGIGTGDTAFEVDVFIKRYPLGYRCIPDPEKALASPFSIQGTPTVLVLKRAGNSWRETYRHEGRFRKDDLNNVLEAVY